MQIAIVVTTVLRVPVPFRGVPFICHTVLKFSISPYLDNHLSESIQIPCRVSFHSTTSDHRFHGGGGG